MQVCAHVFMLRVQSSESCSLEPYVKVNALYTLMYIINSLFRSRALSSVNVKWLWPVDREALSFHLIHNLGSRMGLFHLTLNAKNPLKTEDVEEALFHLQR